MALNIKDATTDRLARELARLTGEPITTATRVAIEERLARVRKAQRVAPRGREVLAAIVERGRQRPMLDRRTADEIIGYDADGVPS